MHKKALESPAFDLIQYCKQKCLARTSVTKSTTKQKVESAIQSDDIISAISEILLMHDAENGIASHFYTVGNTEKYLIRDARNVASGEFRDQFHPYAVMGIQAFRASRLLCKLSGVKDEDVNILFNNEVLLRFYRTISSAKDNPAYFLALFIEKILIPDLASLLSVTSEEALKQLHIAKEFCNIDFKPLHVVTITTHQNSEGKTVNMVHHDSPIYQLTPAEIAMYQDRQEQTWYTNQPAWLQKLIDAYANDIIAGKVIPTQLIKVLPGLRNAGEEFVYALSDKSHECIYHGYHAGNPGHLTKGDNDHLTRLTLDQLLMNIQPTRRLHLNTLISPMMVMSEREHYLFTQCDHAARQRNQWITLSNTPVNILRPVTELKLKSMEGIFHELERLIKFVLVDDNVHDYDDSKLFWAKLKSSIEQSGDKINLLFRENYRGFLHFTPLIQLAVQFITIKKIADSESTGNYNLDLAVILKLLVFHHEQCCRFLKNDNFTPIALLDFCKSGKDREGLLRIRAVSLAISNYLCGYLTLNSDIVSKTDQTIINARQVQRQAGLFGCTLGAEGFVPSSRYALPSSLQRYKHKLFLRTARFNKHYPKLHHQHVSFSLEKQLRDEFDNALKLLRFDEDEEKSDILNMLKKAGHVLSENIYKSYIHSLIPLHDIPAATALLHCAHDMTKQFEKNQCIHPATIDKYIRLTSFISYRRQTKHVLLSAACLFLGVALAACAIAAAVLLPLSAPVVMIGVIISAGLIHAAIASMALLSAGSLIGAGIFASLAVKKSNKALVNASGRFLDLACSDGRDKSVKMLK